MEQHTIEVGGQLVAYESVPGDQAPVVFVPGMAWSSTDFHPLIEGLDRTNVHAVDLRGHGLSGRASEYSFALDVSDLSGFLAEVTGPATLVGWSRGALVSFVLAARHSELARGVYAIDATPYFFENPDRGAMPFPRADVGAVGLVEEYVARGNDLEWLTGALGAFRYGEDSTWLEKIGSEMVAAWAPQMACNDPAMIGPKASFAGPGLTADEICQRAVGPLHVVYGDLDEGSIVAPDEPDRMARSATTATSTHLPGHGHDPHHQSLQAVAADLADFLARNDL